jgi:phosphocarrier protein HPr
MSEMTRRIQIVNELGLHARAASKLVQLTSRLPVELKIGHEDMMVNAKSIMGVLMLAACKGTELTVTASGDQQEAQGALDAVEKLIADRFGEDR